MKAGILTFHNSDNYGAVLQAYALQEKIKELGAKPYLLTVDCGGSSDDNEKSVINSNVKRPPFIERTLAAQKERAGLFAKFREQHLICAEPCKIEEASALNEVYDRFIAGSDQIWNFHIPETDESFFLPFADQDKRYSYAASFGEGEIPAQFRDFCATVLKDFRGLSVRESEGQDILMELTGRQSVLCLDPTLILNRERWESLTHPVECDSYILLFMIQYDHALTDKAKEMAEKENKKLNVVTASFLPQFGFKAWSTVGVEDWLSLIRGADCVFTDSFHGMIFSLIFERPLVLQLSDGSLRSRNGRLAALAHEAGIAEALDGEKVSIGYDRFRNNIRSDYERSVEYLDSVFI